MKTQTLFTGIGVSKGYAIGTALVLEAFEQPSEIHAAQDADTETARLQAAADLAKAQILRIAGSSKANAAIIESQTAFLKDPAFLGEAFSAIRSQHLSAETAISDITHTLYQTFAEMDDAYIRERATDIQDIGERILRNLSKKGSGPDFKNLPENTILIADSLKPSDTAQLDKSKVSAFVTEIGGQTSHTAILAKALGIAAVVGCRDFLQNVQSGDQVIVDGVSGDVLVNPDRQTLENYRTLAAEFMRHKSAAVQTAGSCREIFTADGKRILVAANIGGIDDLSLALQNGAEGVGLFRTEFLYMNREKMPTEEEQFRVFRQAAQMLNGKPLTIRTLDIGGDKSLPYFPLPKEANPFLGLRAIRLCLKHPALFKVQLRAILRASAFGNIRILFPMISSFGELNAAKKVLTHCKSQLDAEGSPYDRNIQTGMMIEIPSAAVLAEEFAKQVDFFSIGTNDLTQYTLAADRMNEAVSELYDPMHPAVLRLISGTITAAHRNAIPCCMCGELASDERAAATLLADGLDEFSVSPGAIADTRCHLIQALGEKR
ncbi:MULTISPECIES: phosphoenolpyruvate--protein phosphotransferase [Caproicibacterium]|uniref:Phosphoenolpyruvate-protein phosphotransferase n=1 Tax=Caproicibacterium argilliputei TaxID=3030016 RepID=A0AA97DAX6_9FIRM|nr:phosphoenolpyruvate--protein phosphotransferase [Caproicibacterium argilliputei]WOC32459.1 phosphoenolpyruvate--protein phosphotransferase [Caproicibacterium argilliputei]